MHHDTGYSTSADRVQVSTNGTSWTNVGTAISRHAATAGWAQAPRHPSRFAGRGAPDR